MLISPIGPQFMQNDGTVAAGCLLYTYATGTTTPQTSYQTQGGTAHTNPIELDSAGRVQPALWLAPDVEYRLRLETASGALIDQWDDIYGVLSATELVSPSDYGADPTGVDDASTAFSSAISQITTNGGGTLLVRPGTYSFVTSTGFTLPAGTRMSMYGATLDFSGAAAAGRLRVAGSIGSGVALSSNAAAGDATIEVSSASGLAAGSLLLLSSDDLVPLDDIGGSTTETIGEFVVVKAISGTTLTLIEPLQDSYLTADSAQIQLVTSSDGVTIEGGTILGGGISGADTSTLEMGITGTYARKLTIRDVTLRHTDYQAIALDQCYDWLIDNVTVEHEERASAAHTAVIQYGHAIKGASAKGRIVGGSILNGKHGIAWTENSNPGVGRDVSVNGTRIGGTWAAAVATHESNTDCSFNDMDIVGCQRGFDIRIAGFKIENCRVRGLPPVSGSTGEAVYLSENAKDGEINNLTVDGCRYGVRGYDSGLPSGATPSNIKIKGGWMRNINQIGIYLEHSENANAKKGIAIEGVDIDDFGVDGIRLNGEFDGAVVKGNNIRCTSPPTGYGVRLMGTLGTRVQHNDFTGMVPVRLENDTQGAPAAPRNAVLVNNVWDHTSGFISAAAGSNTVNQDNIEIGASTLTIAAGAITVPAGVRNIVVDTEGAGATDDLDTINGGNTGDIIFVRAASDARTVVVKDATGNLRLSADMSLTHTDDGILLRWTGAVWSEFGRSDNTA